MKRVPVFACLLAILICAPARAAVQVNLPQDELPHDTVPVEWWYYSGHLQDDTGAHYGVMASFFRFRMGTLPPSHFMIYQLVDKDNKVFHSGSILEKDTVKQIKMMLDGLPEQYRAMIPADMLDEEKIKRHHTFMDGKPVVKKDRLGLKYGAQIFRRTDDGTSGDWRAWRWQTTISSDAFTLDADLTPRRGPMYVGGEGNVGMYHDEDMFYYSFSRLDTAGTLTLNGEQRRITGTLWYDHQFGSFGKELRPVGWDWFCLQLEDGTDLNISALRRPEVGERFNRLATVQFADGTQTVVHDLVIEELGRWTSPDTGITYPSGWILALPSLGMRFTVMPVFPAQEMHTYGPMQAIWEGACTVDGDIRGTRVTGDGYTELVGYNTPPAAPDGSNPQ